jgi:transcription elongation factor Elf1
MEGSPLKQKHLVCKKCDSDKIKIVEIESEGKKFAVCEVCGTVQSIGINLKDRYEKWKTYREAPFR